MALTSANITSIEAVRVLRTGLTQFSKEVADALVALELEGRRPLDWIEHDRTRYWPAEVQKASNEVSEARLTLQKCELTIDGDETKYCYDERKLLEKAKRRLRLAEEKVQAVKRWRMRIRKEVEEFQVQIAKLRGYLDSDLVRAIGTLSRMAEALDKYTQQTSGATGGRPDTSGARCDATAGATTASAPATSEEGEPAP